MSKVNCRTCNNPISAKRVELYPDVVYCSQMCSPKHSSAYPIQGPHSTMCIECQGEIYRPSINGRYCRDVCRVNSWQRRNPAARKPYEPRPTRPMRYKTAPRNGPLLTMCLQCAGDIASPRVHYKFCSKRCGHKYNGNYDTIEQILNRKNRRRERAAAGGLSKAAWDTILLQHDYRCVYCSDPYQEQDHILPISLGGKHEPVNVVPACSWCNRHKSGKHPDVWHEELPGLLAARATQTDNKGRDTTRPLHGPVVNRCLSCYEPLDTDNRRYFVQKSCSTRCRNNWSTYRAPLPQGPICTVCVVCSEPITENRLPSLRTKICGADSCHARLRRDRIRLKRLRLKRNRQPQPTRLPLTTTEHTTHPPTTINYQLQLDTPSGLPDVSVLTASDPRT